MKIPVRYSLVWLVLVVVITGVLFSTGRRLPSSSPVSSVASGPFAAISTLPQPSSQKNDAAVKSSPVAVSPPPAKTSPSDQVAVAKLHVPELAEKLNEELREKSPYDQPDAAMEYYRQKRLPPGATEIPVEKYLEAKAQMDAMPQYSSAQNRFLPSRNELKANRSEAVNEALGTWTPLGPGNIGGRTRALLIHPTTPSVMYAAGVAGGVWKSTNAGALWQPLTDLMANIAVSCLAFDPSNPNVIYAGTGEGFFNGNAVRGAGLFRTTDGGTNWTLLTATNTSDFHYVNDIVISKANPQRMYAGTRTGVWRSLDGGATWTKELNYTDGCLDLVIRTDQTNDYVFAACGSLGGAEVFRNTDAAGAGTWTSVLKETGMGRTSLALAPSNQNVVYAAASSLVTGTFRYGLHAIFRSTNSGESGSWTPQVRNNNPLKLNTVLFTNPLGAFRAECGLGASSFSNQGWYDNVIAVDPLDETKVWVGGIDLFRSDDSGVNWGLASYWWPEPSVPQYAHADHHVIAFHPQYNGSSNKQMFIGTDGGLFRTDDARALVATGLKAACNPAASGVRWTSLNNNYGVTQFYHGAVFPDGKSYFGGTQDNGTLLGTAAAGMNGWREIWGGDGGYVAIDQTTPQVLYASNPFGYFLKSTDGGMTFGGTQLGIDTVNNRPLFIAPLVLDPSNPQRLWTGGNSVWQSLNGGAQWQRISNVSGPTSAMAIAPTNAKYALVGTNSGYLYRFTSSFEIEAVQSPSFSSPRGGFVSGVVFDPKDHNIAYATYSTFGGGAHVWKTINAGLSWTALDGTGQTSVPDIPVHCIAVDPDNSARLFIGTDLGVFASMDGGNSWAVENANFANVPVETLTINTTNEETTLYAFTHGRGAWRVSLGKSGCRYTLSAALQTYPGTAGKGSVDIRTTSDCAWTATSDSWWIVLKPTESGKGNETVRFDLYRNDSLTPRYGVITIGGRSLTIKQEGLKDTTPPVISFTRTETSSIYTSFYTSFFALRFIGQVTDDIALKQMYWTDDRGGRGVVYVTTNRNQWDADITLHRGTTKFTFHAIDTSGNISTLQVPFTYQPEFLITTMASGGNGGSTGDGGHYSAAQFAATGIAFDRKNNLYLTEYFNHRIRKIDMTTGIITTVAGNGTAGFSGDGGLAINAQVNYPRRLAFDKDNNLFFADNYNHRVRRVDAVTGIITTVAGSGTVLPAGGGGGFDGDGGPAASALLKFPYDVVFDNTQNLYISDTNNRRVRKVNLSTGIISSALYLPNGVGALTTDKQGNVYVAEFTQRVHQLLPDGTTRIVAGNGQVTPYEENVKATETQIGDVLGMVFDTAGNFYLSSFYHTIRKVNAVTKLMNTVAGKPIYATPSGDNVPAPEVIFGGAVEIAIDGNDNIYILNNNRIRRLIPIPYTDKTAPSVAILTPTTASIYQADKNTIQLTGTTSDNVGVTTIAWDNGFGEAGKATGIGNWTIPAIPLKLGNNVITVKAWDLENNVGQATLVVSYSQPNAVIAFAGTRTAGFNLETGSAPASQLYAPETVVHDGAGSLYIADTGNHRIRKVTRTGQISTVAGNGQLGSSGDGGLAVNATLNQPSCVAVDSRYLYIADTNNHRIRRVDSAGLITTIAGTGVGGFAGDGGAATQAQLNTPVSIAFDSTGGLLIADAGNHRIRRLHLASGVITTVAGNGYGSGGDGGQATQSQLNLPTSVAVDNAGNWYISDTRNHQVRKVSAAGVITRFAGTGTAGFSGDGGAARSAQLSAPRGVTVDATGNVYVTDQGNHRLRKVAPDGTITTVAGNGTTTTPTSDEGGVAANASLNAPAGVAVDMVGNLFIADTNNHRVVVVAAYKSAATVSAASYAATQPVAAESIVSVFGANLATRDQPVTQLPLPTELAGTSVKVRDSLGVERLAPLFYVGKLQVNYQIPAGTAAGFATVTITNGIGEIFTSAVNITTVTPGLFTATQNGSGAAAASILYFRNGTPRYESSFACDAQGQNCMARQIDLNAGDEVFLELYGTGIRNNSGLANVSATVGGTAVPVLYANKQPDYVGLDQVNIRLPKTLTVRGEVDVLLTVDGKAANAVKINIK